MPLPIDAALWPNEILDKAPRNYIDDLIKKVKIIQEIAQENLSKAQTESKTKYDKKAKIPQYKIRDQVLLKVMKESQYKELITTKMGGSLLYC